MKISDGELQTLSEQALWGLLLQYRSPYLMNGYEMLGLMSRAMVTVMSAVVDAE